LWKMLITRKAYIDLKGSVFPKLMLFLVIWSMFLVSQSYCWRSLQSLLIRTSDMSAKWIQIAIMYCRFQKANRKDFQYFYHKKNVWGAKGVELDLNIALCMIYVQLPHMVLHKKCMILCFMYQFKKFKF
jgi:hypothetical protein